VRTRALDVADRFLVSGCVDNFTADALALFGIPRDRLVGTNDSAAFRPDLLLAPPLLVDPFVVPAHVCDFIRSAVLRSLPPRRRQRRRIFVDRSDAVRRRIVNLDALQPTLAAFGIETVRLAGRSLSEQAALFNECGLVIANHGAALANLVFCEPGTRVLQILAPGMMEREYRTVSQHGRLRHDYLVARFASDADAHLPRKHRDLRLSPALLRRVLDADASVSSTSPPCKTPSPSARPSSSARRTIPSR
jgi:capsular polysaccharide biosynthesis protein